LSNWLRRAGRYRELFDKVLARHGLPRDLFYLAMIESGFESAAKSRVGAGGVWQFMPGAARAYGLDARKLRPVHEWAGGFERFWNESFDRLDAYVQDLKQARQEE
jgi:hypothetical protein